MLYSQNSGLGLSRDMDVWKTLYSRNKKIPSRCGRAHRLPFSLGCTRSHKVVAWRLPRASRRVALSLHCLCSSQNDHKRISHKFPCRQEWCFHCELGNSIFRATNLLKAFSLALSAFTSMRASSRGLAARRMTDCESSFSFVFSSPYHLQRRNTIKEPFNRH